MKQIQAFSVQLANRKLAIQRAGQLANRKLAIQTFALVLLLFAGLNCGTENPVEETVNTSTVETPTGTLRGEVQSIDGVLIQVRLLRDGQLLTQTEIQATYELATIEAGNYTLQISAKGYETKEVNVTVTPGQVVSLDKVALVALATPVSHLRGVLRDEATGEPLGEVNLQLTDKAGKVYEALTTGAGVFTFENLPVEQALTLTIAHAGYEETEVAVHPIPAAETLELRVQLTRLLEQEKLDPGQGLSLGSQAPAFELPDGNGKLKALADYVGNKNVVITFYRGGW
jgi:hypothetical protein